MHTWHMLTAGGISPHSTQLLRTPLVCQQVVQPMERVPDYPRMQCVDSGTQHSLVNGNNSKSWKLKYGKDFYTLPSIWDFNILPQGSWGNSSSDYMDNISSSCFSSDWNNSTWTIYMHDTQRKFVSLTLMRTWVFMGANISISSFIRLIKHLFYLLVLSLLTIEAFNNP